MDDGIWPFSTFFTLAVPFGGVLGWLAFYQREIYKKLFLPLIILVGVVLILSAVWDLSSSTTMAAMTPYLDPNKFNIARAAVFNVHSFSGAFVLDCIISCGYLCFLQWIVESDNKKKLKGILWYAELGNKKGTERRLWIAGSDNKKPLIKKRGKNKRRGNKRKR